MIVSRKVPWQRPQWKAMIRIDGYVVRSASSTSTNSDIDVLIVGGGPIGLSTAFHLATSRGNGGRIAVVERDPTYSSSSAVLSAGGIRQQFSLLENVQMSLYGRDFLRQADTLLHVDNGSDEEMVDVQFQEHGYLFLASTTAGKKQLIKNNKVQLDAGCTDIHLLERDQLKEKFPWLNTSDILLGSYGEKGEGWFDPWTLLRALRKKCQSIGIDFIRGYPVNAIRDETKGHILSVDIMHEEGQSTKREPSVVRYNVNQIVNAAGAHCSKLMEMLAGDRKLSYPLPVEPRKRCIFFFHCATHQQQEEKQQSSQIIVPHIAPLTICPINQVYFRSEGYNLQNDNRDPSGNFLCGVSPKNDDDRAISDMSDLDYADHELWEEVLWPALYNRVPAFGEVKVKSSWAGLYEYNTIDQNGIIDFHPELPNVLMVNGFSGHGLQHAPAAGRAAAELLESSQKKFQTLNLDIFSFDRCHGEKPPVFETGIV